MNTDPDFESISAIANALKERGVGVRVTPKCDSAAEQFARWNDESALHEAMPMLIAIYLSERFRDFDQWMNAQVPLSSEFKAHHDWILSNASAMHRLAGLCKTLSPADNATAVYRNLQREAS